MEKNKKIAYVCMGFVAGVLVTGGVFLLSNKDKEVNMSHSMDGMTSALHGKNGDVFDKEFLSEMIVHHQGAVEMAQMVLAVSKRPELTKLANEIIFAQTKEIEMMKDWQKAWFGTSTNQGQ
jgi:uncharacterized protein (DUF305 family)